MKKNEVLKIIEPIFFDKTFKEVSMQKLADTLKIKKASLYYYFPSKDKLQEELINYSFENYLKFIKNTKTNDLKIFILEFIHFPFKSKNIFSLISQN
jgi:TetR/AcrR family transcriptional repressor of nem operon